MVTTAVYPLYNPFLSDPYADTTDKHYEMSPLRSIRIIVDALDAINLEQCVQRCNACSV